MKPNTRTRAAWALIAAGLLLLVALWFPIWLPRAMSPGIFSAMEGTVTNVTTDGNRIHLQLTGRFRMEQRRDFGRRKRSVLELDCQNLDATLTQNDFFVATTTDGRGGAVRSDPEALLKILKLAGQKGSMVKFELYQPVISFGQIGTVTNVTTAVTRATDADLR